MKDFLPKVKTLRIKDSEKSLESAKNEFIEVSRKLKEIIAKMLEEERKGKNKNKERMKELKKEYQQTKDKKNKLGLLISKKVSDVAKSQINSKDEDRGK